MARVKFEKGDDVMKKQHEEMQKDREAKLDELIPTYAENKSILDDYKKICEGENAEIKVLMMDSNLDKYETGGYKVTKTVSNRDSLNEDKLLLDYYDDEDIKTCFERNKIIKTKKYIDSEALEALIYKLNNKKDAKSKKQLNKILQLVNACTDRKEMVTLRVSKIKEKKA